jgi:hypothetical protein
MCASHTLAHVSGHKYQEGLPTIRYASSGWSVHRRGEVKDPRMKVPESGNRTQNGEKKAALIEFQFLRYVTSMPAVSKLAMVASLVNQEDPCS